MSEMLIRHPSVAKRDAETNILGAKSCQAKM
jgi:hypothetical protein